MDKISKPEELNNYIKVVKMQIWIIIIAGIPLIIGIVFWLFIGKIDGVALIKFVIN